MFMWSFGPLLQSEDMKLRTEEYRLNLQRSCSPTYPNPTSATLRAVKCELKTLSS